MKKARLADEPGKRQANRGETGVMGVMPAWKSQVFRRGGGSFLKPQRRA